MCPGRQAAPWSSISTAASGLWAKFTSPPARVGGHRKAFGRPCAGSTWPTGAAAREEGTLGTLWHPRARKDTQTNPRKAKARRAAGPHGGHTMAEQRPRFQRRGQSHDGPRVNVSGCPAESTHEVAVPGGHVTYRTRRLLRPPGKMRTGSCSCRTLLCPPRRPGGTNMSKPVLRAQPLRDTPAHGLRPGRRLEP